MDLITYNGHAVLHAEIADRRQLLFVQTLPVWVAWIAEEKSFTFSAFSFSLEIRHIHVIAVIIAEHQRVVDNSSAVIRNDFLEMDSKTGDWISTVSQARCKLWTAIAVQIQRPAF